jgi:type IX secretion system PorP/SprF family membrane protein
VETGKGILAFGVQGGIYQHHIDWNNLDMEISDDPVLFTQSYNDILPDANFGVYYYTDDFYIGASSKHLFEIVFVDVTERWNTIYESLARHFYLYSGKKYQVNEKWKLEPSVLLKWVENQDLYFDLNLMANYNKYLDLGVSYRSHVNSVVLLMQLKTNKNLSFGYSYDTFLGEVKAYSVGSHEFTIRYTIDTFARRSACEDFQ